MSLDLSKLNHEQKQAVCHTGGPLLIVAGAGTGKTRVITHRFAYLAEKKLAKPEEILALTFTDKASGEMEDRVNDLLSLGYADLWICTFHSFCERVLRQHGLDIGIAANFKLMDQTAAWLLVRQNLERFRLRYYKPLGNPTKFIHALLNHFSRCKDQGIAPEDYARYAQGDIEEKEKSREISRAYKTYQKLLLDNNLLDFGDLLNYAVRLFKKRPAILAHLRQRFKYILVDEFQDTNWIQYELLKLLAPPTGEVRPSGGAPRNNLTVCADDDQAIYRWRGASFGNIVQFKKDFPRARQIALRKNYRSCQNILDRAYQFIQANNPHRLEYIAKISKRLIAARDCQAAIKHLHFKSAEQETQGVVNAIIQILKDEKNTSFGDFAILVRANDSAQAFARACERTGLPCQFLALKGLYSKPVVLDIISYLKFLNNSNESAALWRVISMPFLMIPGADIARVSQYAHKKSQSLNDSAKEIDLIPGLTRHAAAGVARLLAMAEKHRGLARDRNVSQVLMAFLDDSGYLEHLARQERREEIGYIGQFFARVKEFEEADLDPNLKKFVDLLDMELESGEEGSLNYDPFKAPDAVQIMTVHAAKGLEFKHVFLASLVERKFPVTERSEEIGIPEKLAKDIIPEGNAHLEEERRLFYVAMTRARDGLYFTSAVDYGGVRPKKLSRFLHELGYDANGAHIEVKNTRISRRRPPPAMVVLPAHFSFTQLAAFGKCPLQYKFAHILKIPTPGKAFFSYGKTMHNSLHEFLRDYAPRKGNFTQLAAIYKNNWIDEWYDDKDERDIYYRQGLASLKAFWRDFSARRPQIFKINDAPALELDFNVKINGWAVNGKIDRIDQSSNGVEIIDYKTGNGKESLRPEDKLQLTIYQIAAKDVFGLDANKLTYLYLDKYRPLSFAPAAGDIENGRERIASLIENITRSSFYPTPGWACAWCDYKSICEFAKKR